jgi:hypothetical protein
MMAVSLLLFVAICVGAGILVLWCPITGYMALDYLILTLPAVAICTFLLLLANRSWLRHRRPDPTIHGPTYLVLGITLAVSGALNTVKMDGFVVWKRGLPLPYWTETNLVQETAYDTTPLRAVSWRIDNLCVDVVVMVCISLLAAILTECFIRRALCRGRVDDPCRIDTHGQD